MTEKNPDGNTSIVGHLSVGNNSIIGAKSAYFPE